MSTVHIAQKEAVQHVAASSSAQSPMVAQQVADVLVKKSVMAKPAAAKGWKLYMSADYWLALVGGTTGLTIMAAWFSAGVVIGYLVKRYVRSVILVLLGVVCVVAIGEYCGFVSVNWDAVRSFFQARSQDGFSNMGAQLYADFKLHALWYASGLVGFLLGHIIG